MVFTQVGRSGTALLWGPSGTRVDGITLGTGSSAKTVDTSGLVTDAGLFKTFSSTDISALRSTSFVGDWSSVEMSGTSLKEFGVLVSGGNTWSAEGFPAVTFDGTNELQIQVKWTVF